MASLLVPLACFALSLALVMLVSVWLANRVGDRLIGEKHRALEAIYESGEVPAPWRRPYTARVARLAANPAHAGRLAGLQQEAKEDYLRRLGRLLQYLQHATLVEDEEVRAQLVARLEGVRGEWEKRRASEI